MRAHRADLLAQAAAAGEESKPCEECGAQVPRRRNSTKARWESRRFCSRRCYGADVRRRLRVPDEQFKPRYRTIKVGGREILEHRYVVEQAIGRPLRSDEHVHHRNHNRLDNRLENLEVVTPAEHGRRHTWRPTTKVCVICSTEFTPHKTKRARQQTCGARECWRSLQSLRARQRNGSAA